MGTICPHPGLFLIHDLFGQDLALLKLDRSDVGARKRIGVNHGAGWGRASEDRAPSESYHDKGWGGEALQRRLRETAVFHLQILLKQKILLTKHLCDNFDTVLREVHQSSQILIPLPSPTQLPLPLRENLKWKHYVSVCGDVSAHVSRTTSWLPSSKPRMTELQKTGDARNDMATANLLQGGLVIF